MSEAQRALSTELDALDPQTAQSQLFQATFDLASCALVLLDDQGRMLKVNGAFAKLLGYSLPELLGKPFLDLLQSTHQENLQALHGTSTLTNLTDRPLELYYRRKDGSVLHGRSKLVTVGTLLLGEIVPLPAPQNLDECVEQALLDSEASLSLMDFAFSHTHDAAYLIDNQARLRYVNDEACRSLGYSREELLRMTLADVDPDWTNEQVLEGWSNHSERPPETIESRHRPRDGRIFPVEISITYIELGGQHYSLALARDITERREMESRLQTSEQQFRALAENSLNLIIRYDLNCQRTYVNPAFERETGIPAAQARHRPLEDSWDPEMPVAEYLALLRQVISTGEPLETVLAWPHPENAETVVHAIQLIAERGVDGAVTSVLAKGHNITALKRHERLEEARLCIFEQLARGAPLAEVLVLVTKYIEQARPDFLASIMLVDDDGRYLLPGSISRLPPDYQEALGHIEIGEGIGICGTAAWRGTTVIAGDLSTHPYCVAFREQAIKSGLRACWSVPIKDSVGKVLGTFCTYLRQPGLPTDDDLKLVHQTSHLAAIAIERKRAETLLFENEKRYREIFDNSLDSLFLLEVTEEGDFRYIEVNPALERSIGKGRAELIGKTIEETLPPHIAAAAIVKYQRCVEGGAPIDEEEELDLPSGLLTFHSTLIPLRGASGRTQRIVGIARDISAMRAAERRLKASHAQLRQLSSHRETTREEERKRIAREVHDELGQQLTALRMDISLLRLQFGNDHPLVLERVQALMVRVDETIQVVRNVATALRPSALDMGLTPALEWLVSEFSENTGIYCRLRAPSARLELDDERATATFRVIQESLTNIARHAQASHVDIHLERCSEHVLIEVRDNGKGFDPEQLPKGTLGMLGMYERGHMLGGAVTIDSTPGQGTRVRVSIPFQVVPEPPHPTMP